MYHHKGLVYVSYYVKDCRKAPEQKLTFHTGINNGVFNAYQHTNDEWKRMLDSAIAEVIDMQGKYVHLTFDVKTLREKGSDCGVEMIRMYDRIILWQQEMLGIDQFGYRTNNHMFARISWAGPPNANGRHSHRSQACSAWIWHLLQLSTDSAHSHCLRLPHATPLFPLQIPVSAADNRS